MSKLTKAQKDYLYDGGYEIAETFASLLVDEWEKGEQTQDRFDELSRATLTDLERFMHDFADDVISEFHMNVMMVQPVE